MSRHTAIQWCDSTVNPTMGCEGCELWNPTRRSCYAGVLHQRFGGRSPGYAPAFEQVTRFPGRMADAARWRDLRGTVRPDKPWLSGLPRGIFISDMSDALSSSVPFDYLQSEVIRAVCSDEGRRHRWLWLSKRPQRMVEFARWLADRETGWPANLWAGTSITDRASLGRVAHLAKVGDAGTARFLSVEPQTESLDLSPWLSHVHWVIQGGESGRDARPFEVNWARRLMEQCEQAGVPYFLKQLGAAAYQDGNRLQLRDAHGGDWSEWPGDVRIRQMPAASCNRF